MQPNISRNIRKWMLQKKVKFSKKNLEPSELKKGKNAFFHHQNTTKVDQLMFVAAESCKQNFQRHLLGRVAHRVY